MDVLRIGDIVTRKSYGSDIYFRIIGIQPGGYIDLVGIDYRIRADAHPMDLYLIEKQNWVKDRLFFTNQVDQRISNILKERRQRDQEKYGSKKAVRKTGKVLHIDGDSMYLNICMNYYEKLGIHAQGETVAESRQPQQIKYLLAKYQPDIVVITGHDSIAKEKDPNNIESYRSSYYFVEAVRQARQYESDMDTLVIFAGACQSYYEEIIGAGANFASSPERIMIHALDPVFVSEKIAYSSVKRVLTMEEILSNTITNVKGIGGFETRGKAREGAPVT
ncbi:MAG: sporulation peptidase YabG [Epulopiscium sp.]|nr:sporulation peptidase YabG [Candidatus Epulonipiscium sp.]